MSNQAIYIPEYVEQGVAKLQQAKTALVQLEASINSGISTINASGYNRGIPHIEKGSDVSNALTTLESTIDTITSAIERYSNGEALDLESTIIIADPNTIEKYGLKKEDIDYNLSEYIFNSETIQTSSSASTIKGKWDSNYLTAAAGSNIYTGADGRLTKETWCDLNPNNLAKLMREQHGIELDFWIREDGVYMYGDYVMVAADIPHMDGTEQAAEYRKGDLVETSLGTGMVVDLCGMAEMTRKGQTDVDVWYDIYTAWHDGGKYQHVGYCKEDNCSDSRHGQTTMVRKAENPTTVTTQLRSEQVLNSNSTGQTTTAATTTNSNTIQSTTQTVGSTTTNSQNTFVSTTTGNNTTNTNSTVNTNTNQSVNTNVNTGVNNYQNTTSSNTGSYTNTTGTGNYTSSGSSSGGGSSSGYTGSSSDGTFTSSGGGSSSGTSSSSTSTTPSSSQVSSIYNVNGFSKPTTTTTTNTPVVSNPVTTTPSTTVTTTPAESTPVFDNTTQTLPEVDVTVHDTIITTPVETPEVTVPEVTPEVEQTIENIPTTTPADTVIEDNRINAVPIIATATAGALAVGVGVKAYQNHKQNNQNDDNYDEEDSYEEE